MEKETKEEPTKDMSDCTVVQDGVERSVVGGFSKWSISDINALGRSMKRWYGVK